VVCLVIPGIKNMAFDSLNRLPSWLSVSRRATHHELVLQRGERMLIMESGRLRVFISRSPFGIRIGGSVLGTPMGRSGIEKKGLDVIMSVRTPGIKLCVLLRLPYDAAGSTST
jgi:hypothetical protein